MARIGIIGLGFMGKMHFRCLKAIDPTALPSLGIRNSVVDGDLVIWRDESCRQQKQSQYCFNEAFER